MLLLLAGLGALVLTRGFEAFRPLPGGSVLYDHSIEQAIHVAFSWEALRGLPLAELPTAAGLRFPHYHALGYAPLAWASRWAGVGLVTVHHALAPPLVVALLGAGAHLAVRARTGRHATSLAVVIAALFVVPVAESVWVETTFRGRVPLEFVLRSTSGGAGTLVFVAVAALLAAARPAERRPLLLAAALAGIAYGVKAQMFLMLGVAFLVLLAALALRTRSPRTAWTALAVFLGCSAPLALIGRASERLGRPHLVPGLFAQECGFGPLLAPYGFAALWLVGGPLALWSILRFSPLVPAFVVSCLRRCAHLLPAVDLFLALASLVALAFTLGLAAEELQRGEISTLVVREGLFALQMLAIGVDVVVLAWLLGRRHRDGGRAILAGAGLAAIALAPIAWHVRLHLSGSPPMVLSAGEVGALAHLRDATPLDAVVAHLRGATHPAQPSARGLHPMPLVAALAGRRTVLEYYRPDVDRSVNRHRSLRQLFATSDAAEGEAILRRFGVDYVLEYRAQPLRFATPRLDLVYDASDVRLWRVSPLATVGAREVSSAP